MTQTEYAAHRGVSRQAISKLVKQGKIPASAFIDGKIDPAAADFALGETRERILSADDDGEDFGGADPTFGSAAGTRQVASDSSVARLTQAKTATEIYRARTAELEYDQRVGKLLSTEDVTRSMEKCAAVIVRELEGLPNFADEIAAAIAKDGLPGARQALKNIARNVRLALEQNMRVVATQDDEAGKEGVTS
ncbi:hypothetical protein [Bradyrhizobium sp. BRP23]|uniref:hypothetical protein n=1 Tax=Bradyrhizobium sp. BRP23 TaxID=2793820 RepID=UPI001CD6B4E4|nr:hypothetical protein [Bradyrhizobium sp. BRP23]MCA1381287.1 hypothetical protein [Bradyrhizobium sp. BRP05]MCA1418593.1 hypothetical protein [Bradyrhizobium sp. BRP23]